MSEPIVTAYLCAEEYVEGDQICALFKGHPLDREPGHVWVSIETLIEAGTVAWHAAAGEALRELRKGVMTLPYIAGGGLSVRREDVLALIDKAAANQPVAEERTPRVLPRNVDPLTGKHNPEKDRQDPLTGEWHS